MWDRPFGHRPMTKLRRHTQRTCRLLQEGPARQLALFAHSFSSSSRMMAEQAECCACRRGSRGDHYCSAAATHYTWAGGLGSDQWGHVSERLEDRAVLRYLGRSGAQIARICSRSIAVVSRRPSASRRTPVRRTERRNACAGMAICSLRCGPMSTAQVFRGWSLLLLGPSCRVSGVAVAGCAVAWVEPLDDFVVPFGCIVVAVSAFPAGPL